MQRTLSYPKNKIKVLLLENIHQKAIDLFTQEGYQVESLKYALSEDDLVNKVSDISILGLRSKTKITRNVLEHAKKLHVIGAFCIGTNQIDLATAAHKGISVFNAPYSNTRSVVELAIGEIIMLYRRIFEKSMMMQKGIWDKSMKGCHEVRGKKLGIVGYGNIGSQVSVLAELHGMQVYFYDIEEKLALGNAKQCDSLKELLHIADIVTLHVDGRKENTDLISAKEFSLMKDGVIFLNLSRGCVVNIEVLAKHIKNGKVAGAALDVFPNEPKSNDEAFRSILQDLPNVILTPHIGGNTLEAQKDIGNFVGNKIISFVNTGNTTLSVNFPNLALPDQAHSHRVIHIHKNKPGVLARINTVFAENDINIEGQYLKTNDSIGYVITDVNTTYKDGVIQSLKTIPSTCKLRVLY